MTTPPKADTIESDLRIFIHDLHDLSSGLVVIGEELRHLRDLVDAATEARDE